MTNLRTIKKILSDHKSELSAKYPIEGIGIFGSYVRGEQNIDSDVDILVDFNDDISLFQFIDIEDYISSLLHTKVDLVTRSTLKPNIGKYILNEVVMI